MKFFATIVNAALFGVTNISVAEAQSAKFAAVWSTDVEVAGECLNTDNQDMIDFWGSSLFSNFEWCDMVSPDEDVDLALSQFAGIGSIKIPQQWEIMITLSAQIDILTVNTATSRKGKDDEFYGNIGATSASAGVNVQLYAVPVGGSSMIECMPDGGVTMASRYVELRNLIGGEVTYEDCFRDDDDELVCPTKVADTELASTIGLAMDTAAAHSFQWLCVDMASGEYDIVAQFTLSSEVANLCDSTLFGDCTDNVDLAAARVALNKRIMTVQQVRAVKDAFADLS